MFGGKQPNYMKLRTNLRLAVNRLKMLEKKKSELALKARREIADYIGQSKEDRARIRVEHIVREDYLVEAMEIIEMYCDLLQTRFGIIQKMKELDPGIEEAVATIIWAAPRLWADVQELKTISDHLTLKYGKEFAQQCKVNGLENVNEKVMHKLAITAPPKILIERYMEEIAKAYNVPFEPDQTIIREHEETTHDLIDLPPDDKKGGGGGSGGGGGMVFPSAPGPSQLYPRMAGATNPMGPGPAPVGPFGPPVPTSSGSAVPLMPQPYVPPAHPFTVPQAQPFTGPKHPPEQLPNEPGPPGYSEKPPIGGVQVLPNPTFSLPSDPGNSPSGGGSKGGEHASPPLPGSPPSTRSPSGGGKEGGGHTPPPLPVTPPNAHSSPGEQGPPEMRHPQIPNSGGGPESLPPYDTVMDDPSAYPPRGPAQQPSAPSGPHMGDTAAPGNPNKVDPNNPPPKPPRANSPGNTLDLPSVPGPSAGMKPSGSDLNLPDISGLPDVPSAGKTSTSGDDIDFDDLSRRFEELKKKK